MQSQLQELLSRELSRKEFLQYLGLAFLGVTGVLGVLKSLQLQSSKTRSSNGYGSNIYGGFKK